MPPKRKPQPPKNLKPSASYTRKIKVRPMKVGKRGGVFTTKNGVKIYRKKNTKIPRLKLTSSQKKRQKAALKQISPLRKKITKKSNLPKRKRSRSRSRSRSSSKSKSSSILSSLSSLVSN